ncbi:hypothetical protein EVAR_49167_1 [Eumeta japonica]|uniref:Uncharacterized protein n=1 Tax=Eumeta variegata TaxID=151549 RepID=A0A4C1YN75_EUMVA|nr:hypothetical protein EVAR_49167_1 [Eumeta japonica]
MVWKSFVWPAAHVRRRLACFEWSEPSGPTYSVKLDRQKERKRKIEREKVVESRMEGALRFSLLDDFYLIKSPSSRIKQFTCGTLKSVPTPEIRASDGNASARGRESDAFVWPQRNALYNINDAKIYFRAGGARYILSYANSSSSSRNISILTVRNENRAARTLTVTELEVRSTFAGTNGRFWPRPWWDVECAGMLEVSSAQTSPGYLHLGKRFEYRFALNSSNGYSIRSYSRFEHRFALDSDHDVPIRSCSRFEYRFALDSDNGDPIRSCSRFEYRFALDSNNGDPIRSYSRFEYRFALDSNNGYSIRSCSRFETDSPSIPITVILSGLALDLNTGSLSILITVILSGRTLDLNTGWLSIPIMVILSGRVLDLNTDSHSIPITVILSGLALDLNTGSLSILITVILSGRTLDLNTGWLSIPIMVILSGRVLDLNTDSHSIPITVILFGPALDLNIDPFSIPTKILLLISILVVF